MAAPEYRIECITGVVDVRKRPVILTYALNRGSRDEHVHIELWRQLENPTRLFGTSDDVTLVRPGALWVSSYSPLDDQGPLGYYWLRIKLTSENLIPSIIFVGGTRTEPNQVTNARYGPQDFARYKLPRVLHEEPITPVEDPVVG
jgi:hypothetical protein